MSKNEEIMTSEEEAKNNKFSFIVGIFIGLAVIILFTVLATCPLACGALPDPDPGLFRPVC